MNEIWKDIKGYEGIYQISNFGRIKSLERKVINHKKGSTRTIKEKIMIPSDNGNGYKIIFLASKGKRKRKYIHRLVAEHFLKKKKGKNVINHKDYNKENNCVENLEWCNQKENINHSIIHMQKPRKKFKSSKSGHKYIYIRDGKYRVCVTKRKIDKCFFTLDEAISYRDSVVKGVI